MTRIPSWPVLLVDDSAANDGYAGREMVVVGGGTVVTVTALSGSRASRRLPTRWVTRWDSRIPSAARSGGRPKVTSAVCTSTTTRWT